MDCITPPALDDLEIAMYVDGEADEAVIAHIQQCSYCEGRARQWQQVQNDLRKRSYRVECPSPMALGEYHLGYLPDPQKLVLAQHVRECVLCRREVSELDDFLASLAPEANLWGGAKVLITRLIGAHGEGGFVPALRGEAKGPLTFEADGTVIILDVQSVKGGTFQVFGQVAADDQEKWTDALVEIRQGDELEFSTRVDDLGAFRSEGVGQGSRELRITPRDGSLILVSNFML